MTLQGKRKQVCAPTSAHNTGRGKLLGPRLLLVSRLLEVGTFNVDLHDDQWCHPELLRRCIHDGWMSVAGR